MSKRIQLPAAFTRFCLLLVVQLLLLQQAAAQTNRIDSSRLSGYDPENVGPDTFQVEPPPVYEEELEDGEEQSIAVETVPVTDRFLDRSAPGPGVYSHRQMTAAQKAAQKADKEYWYADYDFSRPEKKKATDNYSTSRWDWLRSDLLQTLLWIVIIGGFATVLILYLRNNNIGLFRGTKKISNEELNDETQTDIFAINYDQEIGKAANAGNYRLATRLLFLRLLKTMSDRHVISYKPDSTNMDYLMQLAGGPLYKDFFQLARAYEYVWYGEFSIDQEKYNLIRSEFETMNQKTGRP